MNDQALSPEHRKQDLGGHLPLQPTWPFPWLGVGQDHRVNQETLQTRTLDLSSGRYPQPKGRVGPGFSWQGECGGSRQRARTTEGNAKPL